MIQFLFSIPHQHQQRPRLVQNGLDINRSSNGHTNWGPSSSSRFLVAVKPNTIVVVFSIQNTPGFIIARSTFLIKATMIIFTESHYVSNIRRLLSHIFNPPVPILRTVLIILTENNSIKVLNKHLFTSRRRSNSQRGRTDT